MPSKASLKVDRVLDAYQLFLGCRCCGRGDYAVLLDNHHVNPDDKHFAVGHSCRKSLDQLIPELMKTEVLCANCHRLVHAGVIHL